METWLTLFWTGERHGKLARTILSIVLDADNYYSHHPLTIHWRNPCWDIYVESVTLVMLSCLTPITNNSLTTFQQFPSVHMREWRHQLVTIASDRTEYSWDLEWCSSMATLPYPERGVSQWLWPVHKQKYFPGVMDGLDPTYCHNLNHHVCFVCAKSQWSLSSIETHHSHINTKVCLISPLLRCSNHHFIVFVLYNGAAACDPDLSYSIGSNLFVRRPRLSLRT